jgi:NADH-quinone oxidoreductase subunit N
VPAEFAPSSAELCRFLPEMVLVVAGTLAMVLAAVRRSRQTNLFSSLAFIGFVAALAASVFAFRDPGTAFRDMLVVDGFTTFFRVLVISVGALTTLASTQYLRREMVESGEYYALLLFSVDRKSVV